MALPVAKWAVPQNVMRGPPNELNGELVVPRFTAKHDWRADSAKQQMSGVVEANGRRTLNSCRSGQTLELH